MAAKFTQIPSSDGTPEGMQRTIQALVEAVNTLIGATQHEEDRAVRYAEFLDGLNPPRSFEAAHEVTRARQPPSS